MNKQTGHPRTRTQTWHCWQRGLRSTARYKNPYADVTIKVTFEGPEHRRIKAFGFWDGGRTFRIRCAFPAPGDWTWRTTCSNPKDTGLHDRRGTVTVSTARTKNPLYKHGFLKVSKNGRYLTHADNTPFFWLGDTPWSGPFKSTDKEWARYLKNRAAKGVSVIQVAMVRTWLGNKDADGNVAFTKPDASQWNPAFWRRFERKVQAANERGLAVFIVGVMDPINRDKKKDPPHPKAARLFARNLAARLFGHHVIFSPAFDDGHEQLPIMRATGKALRAATKEHLISNHFGTCPVEHNLHAEPWLGFNMFQSGHNAWRRERQLEFVTARAREMPLYLRALPGPKPCVNGEAIYEGESSRNTRHGNARTVRHTAYLSLLSGACGYTFGVQSIWRWKPDWATWLNRDASRHMALLGKLFRQFEWWRLRPAHRLIRNQPKQHERKMVLARGNRADFAIAYLPDNPKIALDTRAFRGPLAARWVNPRDGSSHALRRRIPNRATQRLARPATGDWVLILET